MENIVLKNKKTNDRYSRCFKDEDFQVISDEDFICVNFFNCKFQNIKFINCTFIGCNFKNVVLEAVELSLKIVHL